MAKAVKMKDIAQRLNVSTMTVSKALSGKPGVSEVMREKIKTLAFEMGYIPSGEIREGMKKSYNIGVILAKYYTEKWATFYWKMYQEINTRAVEQNCFVLLEIIGEEEENNQEVPKLIRENKVDGLMALGCVDSSCLKMLHERVPVPVVYMDFYVNDIFEDSVISNSFYGTYEITNYLFHKGHHEIAFVGTLFSTKSITDRYLGYEKAMIEHGQKVREEWIIPDRVGERESYDSLTLPSKMPTAFVCNCDLTASKLIKLLQETGRRVPEDISVVGYDDYLYPGLCNVDITSYGVDMEQMALTGISILLKKISKTDYRRGIHVVSGYLSEKQSVMSR